MNEHVALRLSAERPWPSHVVDTTRTLAYGVPLNLLTTFAFPVHDADARPKVLAWRDVT